MGWAAEIVTSEFLWGIVLGVLLSIVAAYASAEIQRRSQQKRVLNFAFDLTTNISEIVEQLEDIRTRTNIIENEFLELIMVEVSIYGRCREHMVAIEDAGLRREIREYFTRIAAAVGVIRVDLRRLGENWVPTDVGATSQEAAERRARAEAALAHARQRCDQLAEFVRRRSPDLVSKLSA